MRLVPDALATRYRGLAPRERRLVAIGGGVLALLVVYLAGIQPALSAHAHLMYQLRQRRALLGYIDSAAPRLQGTGSPGNGGLAAGQSVFAAVSAAAQSSAVAAAVRRLEQTGDGGVRVSLSGARFDALVRWLGELAHGSGIVVTTGSIERAADPGTVNATLTLNSR